MEDLGKGDYCLFTIAVNGTSKYGTYTDDFGFAIRCFSVELVVERLVVGKVISVASEMAGCA